MPPSSPPSLHLASLIISVSVLTQTWTASSLWQFLFSVWPPGHVLCTADRDLKNAAQSTSLQFKTSLTSCFSEEKIESPQPEGLAAATAFRAFCCPLPPPTAPCQPCWIHSVAWTPQFFLIFCFCCQSFSLSSNDTSSKKPSLTSGLNSTSHSSTVLSQSTNFVFFSWCSVRSGACPFCHCSVPNTSTTPTPTMSRT